jgi:hypothetical protein
MRAAGAPASAKPASHPASPKLPLVLAGLIDWTPPEDSSAEARSRSRLPAAAPFVAPERAPGSAARALACLTAAVYHEARSESGEGQRAVAQVVLNRARHYAFPSSICGVVYQGSGRRTGCQFTFTCDGSLGRPRDEAAWRRAELVARQALDGHVEAQVSWATHYHAGYVRPYWSRSLAKVRAIGGHVFYRLPGDAGEAAAFVRRSSSLEPSHSSATRLQPRQRREVSPSRPLPRRRSKRAPANPLRTSIRKYANCPTPRVELRRPVRGQSSSHHGVTRSYRRTPAPAPAPPPPPAPAPAHVAPHRRRC